MRVAPGVTVRDRAGRQPAAGDEEAGMTRLSEQHARRARAPADGVSTRTATVGLRIQPELKEALQQRAREARMTVNYFIEGVLSEHIARLARIKKSKG